MDLLITNLQYVFLRLAVTGPLVKFAMKYIPYYVAVVLMAQLSFCYDLIIFYFYFDSPMGAFSEVLLADFLYTLRVVAAWWVIKRLWDWLNNYWMAVFIGAELTFTVDYFIFDGVY